MYYNTPATNLLIKVMHKNGYICVVRVGEMKRHNTLRYNEE